MTAIKILSLVEHVRTRPGMYVGGLNSRGLLYAIDGVIDDYMNLHGASVEIAGVEILDDREVRLELVGVIPGCRSSQAQVDPEPSPPVGMTDLAIASALCEKLEFDSLQNAVRERRTFVKGAAVSERELSAPDRPPSLRLHLKFDSSIFPPDASLRFLSLCGRIQELAIFHPNTIFSVKDARLPIVRQFKYAQGLLSYLEEVEFDCFDPDRRDSRNLVRMSIGVDGETAEAVVYNAMRREQSIRTFVNGRRSVEHGSHLRGLELGFNEVHTLVRAEQPSTFSSFPENLLDGATILLAVKLRDPHWANATKSRLDSPTAEALVHRMVSEQLPSHLRKYPA